MSTSLTPMWLSPIFTLMLCMLALGCSEPATPLTPKTATLGDSFDSAEAIELDEGEWLSAESLRARILSGEEMRCEESEQGILCGANYAPLAASTYCTLYVHSGYAGSYVKFTSGRDYNDLHEMGLGDNISSVYCSGGGQVYLYKDKNFSGTGSGWISYDNYMTSPRGFNDIASAAYFNF